MANTIITKNSSTASSVPTSGDLVQGELAVNVTDKRLFTENAGGTVVELGTNPTTIAVAGNATVGGTLGVTGTTTLAGASVTSLTNSGSTTLSGGTANGVAYLNGSKVLTSGSALTFNGSTFGVNFSSASNYKFYVSRGGTAGELVAFTDGTAQTLTIDTAASSILLNSANGGALAFGVSTEQMRLTTTGLGIGTTLVTAGSILQTNGAILASNVVTARDTTNLGVQIGGGGAVAAGGASTVAGIYADINGFGGASDLIIRPRSDTSPGALRIYTGSGGGTERARIDSSGLFQVINATEAIFRLNHTASNTWDISNDSNLKFSRGGTERARIDSSGNLLVGRTSRINNGRLEVLAAASEQAVVSQVVTNGNSVFQGFNASGALCFQATGNGGVYASSLGTGTVYSSSGHLTNTNPSDERLKSDITDLSWGLNEVLKLRPVSYSWKNNPTNQGTQYGWIAQEVQSVMPELIREFDAQENGETVKRLGLEKEGIYAAMVKAIQEQQAIIESLKARLDAANL